MVVDDGQEARADGQDLADQLASDRSAAAGHQNAGAVEVARHRVRVDLHRGAAEQVLDADLSNPVGERVAADQLARVRDRPDLQAKLLAALEGAPHGRPRGRRHGHQQLAGVGIAGHLRQRLEPAVDALAHQARAVLRGIVVDEAHDVQSGIRVARGDPRDGRPRLAGSVDDRGQSDLLVRAPGNAASLQAGTQREASAADEGKAQERLRHEDRPREAGGSAQAGVREGLEDGHGQNRAGDDGTRQREHLLDRGVAPLAPVQAEDGVRGRHDQERQERDRHERRDRRADKDRVEPQAEAYGDCRQRGRDVVDEEMPAPGHEGPHRPAPGVWPTSARTEAGSLTGRPSTARGVWASIARSSRAERWRRYAASSSSFRGRMTSR